MGKQMSINTEVVPFLFIPSPFPGHHKFLNWCLMGKALTSWFPSLISSPPALVPRYHEVPSPTPQPLGPASQLTLCPHWTSSWYSSATGVFSPLCLCSHYFSLLECLLSISTCWKPTFQAQSKHLLHEVSSNRQMLHFRSLFNPFRLCPI